MGDSKGLTRLSDHDLAEMFRRQRNDPKFLDLLNEELKSRHSSAAADLHIEVAQARLAMARLAAVAPNAPSVRVSGPVRDWLQAFFAVRGLERPDGRPLYRYRMADEEYEQAKRILRHLASAGRLADPDIRAGSLFVAYCAEWFRRESETTFLRWDDPAPDLFPSVPYLSKQELTDFGLRFWRRPLRRSEHAREFLLTVALEGGFPVRILADGARGWLKEYLRAIMRRAVALRVDTLGEILAIAEEERGRMRKGYQHDDFIALCSELVERLLALRQTAEAEGVGEIRNSVLLDAKHPGWRDELPIYVPAEDEALVTDLLSGLINEKMTGLSTDGVEARRYLAKVNGEWRPALQLLADGEIASARLPGLSALGRVRAIPTGELGKHMAGELALLEPPLGEQRRWRVRPFMRTTRLLTGFPFAAPVTASLTSPGGVPHAWTWPRGDALRSDVLVFREDEGSTSKEPLLRFVRAGSVSSPVKVLHVLVPDDWTVESAEDGTGVEVELVPELRRKLVRLSATAYFSSSDNESVRFRVAPGAEDREQELELASVKNAGFELAEDASELVASPEQPLIREARSQLRRPVDGELFVRPPGGRWTQLTGPVVGDGMVEVSWRDPVANIQIEKRRLALVPSAARISGSMRNAKNGEIRLQGLPGWTATVQGAAYEVEAQEDATLSITFAGRPTYRLPMRLRPPTGHPVDVLVLLVGREAVIALADGAILAPGSSIDLGALRGAVAVAPARTVIHLAAKGSRSGGINTVVDGELPLAILRSAIGETLATLPDQDDLVELEFVGDTRPPIRISRYRHKQLACDGGVVRWAAPSAPSALELVARMILDPRHEHRLEPAGDGLWRLPEQCKGACLVYLRDDVDVVSRPVAVAQPGIADAYSGVLISALELRDHEERQRAITSAFEIVARGEASSPDFTWLRDAIVNLNGLPASSIDALKLLPRKAEVLVRLLLNARDDGQRGAIWALQQELPFLWLGLPIDAWRSAMVFDATALAKVLTGALGEEKATGEAVTWLRGVCSELAILEPALNTISRMVGIPVDETSGVSGLRDLMSGYIRDQHQRRDEATNDLGARIAARGLRLPPEFAAIAHSEFAGLFAPVALAASARGRLRLDRELATIARRTLREDPAYVSAAWSHLVKFYELP